MPEVLENLEARDSDAPAPALHHSDPDLSAGPTVG